MAENKGKPSGSIAENKTSPGKKAENKRTGWPEDAPTQRMETIRGQRQGVGRTNGTGRNRKAH